MFSHKNKYTRNKIMPKSRKRGGSKEHRKRVQSRNTKIQTAQLRFQEQYQAEILKQIEAMRAKFSADTENDEIIGDEQPLNIKL